MTHHYIIVLLPVSARFHGNSTGPMVITLMLYVVYYTVWKASLFGAFLSLSACIWTEYRELFCKSSCLVQSPNAGKCRPEKPRIQTLYLQSLFPVLARFFLA